MKVLDASFLIDYGNGVAGAERYYTDHQNERFVVPSPVYTEHLLGTVHSHQPTDIPAARQEIAWTAVIEISEQMAVVAAEIADEVGPQGPNLTAIDALVAAVGRELNAPVVSSDSDLTHDETQKVIDVEEYQSAAPP
jgi:predicted nucleic acid-binding protein